MTATVTTVTEFIEAVGRQPTRSTSILCFRGQRNSDWIDNPGILRESSKLLPFEYNAVRDLHAIHSQEFFQDQYMFDRLVRMQHYGLPTRLLDVTANPLVALFFASEPYGSRERQRDGKVIIYDVPAVRRKYFDSDSISCVANLANLNSREKEELLNGEEESIDDFNKLDACDRLLQFIRAEKPHFRPIIDSKDLIRAHYVTPKMQNRRIIAQQGAFIAFGLKIVRVPSGTSGVTAISRSNIIVPYDSKATIRKQLSDLGINNTNLFPEMSHAAADIVRRYT